MTPRRCIPDETVTTRSVMAGSSRLVSAKWPRWLVPICISKPSAVLACGIAITPALLISTSIRPDQSSANALTDSSEARSSRRTSLAPPTSAAACRPLASSRTASTTRAPAPASASAACLPIPLFAPVTTKVRPLWSARSATVHLWLMHPQYGEGHRARRARVHPVDHTTDRRVLLHPVGGGLGTAQ